MENLHADVHALLPVFLKVDLFIGVKHISSTSRRNERIARFSSQRASSGSLAVVENRNS